MVEIKVPDTQEEIAPLIFKIRAYETYEKRPEFPSKHPFIGNARGLLLDYLDMRLFNGRPEERSIVMNRLAENFKKTGAEIVCGYVSADLTYVGMVAQLLGVPCFYVREEEKAHGTGRVIEGMREDEIVGKKCAHTADLLTTGKSGLNLTSPVRDIGGLLFDHLPIFSRLQGGEEKLAQLNPPINVRSLCIADKSFYEIGLRQGAVTEEFLEENKIYRADENAWAANYLNKNPDFFRFELQKKGVIVNGELRKSDALEVLTKKYTQLKDSFAPYIRELLEELKVTQSVPEFGYRV